jgi:hypothetical protein
MYNRPHKGRSARGNPPLQRNRKKNLKGPKFICILHNCRMIQRKLTHTYMVNNRVYVGDVVVRVVSKKQDSFTVFFLYLRQILLDHCCFWFSPDWERWNEQSLQTHPIQVSGRAYYILLACFEKINVSL